MSTALHTITVIRRERCDPEMDWLSGLHLDARNRAWYGEVVLTYRAGKIVMVRRNETIAVPQF